MRRLLIGLILLVVGCIGRESDVAQTEQATHLVIQSECTKASGDSLARFPWETSYPIGNQHVSCAHKMNESTSAQPLGTSACVDMPGLHQFDVWVRDGNLANEYCARVTTSVGGHWHVDYVEMLELGWRATLTDAPHQRWVEGITMGSGTVATMSTLPDVYANGDGCQVAPYYACQSRVFTQNNSGTYWFQTLDGPPVNMRPVSLDLMGVGFIP